MTTLARLERWRENGSISNTQFDALAELVRKDLFSVFIELNGLLYLGVLSLIAGIGWSVQAYFANLGDAAILSFLTVLFLASLYYCFSRALPYSSNEVESPNMALDYVLYGGCLVFALDLGYLESRFHLLQDHWDFYLLFSSLLFFVLAYRFDNRLVLSLALSSLAGWFGVTVSRFAFNVGSSLRPFALAYGVVVTGIGTGLYKQGIKKHFTETYLHIAANVVFVALLSGVLDADGAWLYLAAVLVLTTIAIVEGVRFRRFVFVAYGTIYGYIGVSIRVLQDSRIYSTFALGYLILSGLLVVASMALLARHSGREQ